MINSGYSHFDLLQPLVKLLFFTTTGAEAWLCNTAVLPLFKCVLSTLTKGDRYCCLRDMKYTWKMYKMHQGCQTKKGQFNFRTKGRSPILPFADDSAHLSNIWINLQNARDQPCTPWQALVCALQRFL